MFWIIAWMMSNQYLVWASELRHGKILSNLRQRVLCYSSTVFESWFFCEISRSKAFKIKYVWHFHLIYLNICSYCEWSSNMTNWKSFTTYGNHSIRIFILLKCTNNCHYTHSINKSHFTTIRWIFEVWNRYKEWMWINSLWLNDGNFDTAYD